MTEREGAHDYLAGQLNFPPWYGRNLDALYDLLTERGPTVVQLVHREVLARPGTYGNRLLDTLLDAEKANPNLTIVSG